MASKRQAAVHNVINNEFSECHAL